LTSQRGNHSLGRSTAIWCEVWGCLSCCYRSSVTAPQGPTTRRCPPTDGQHPHAIQVRALREKSHSRRCGCDIAGDQQPALAPLQEPMAWFGGRGLMRPAETVECSACLCPAMCLPNYGTRLGRQVGNMSTVGKGKREKETEIKCIFPRSEDNQQAVLSRYGVVLPALQRPLASRAGGGGLVMPRCPCTTRRPPPCQVHRGAPSATRHPPSRPPIFPAHRLDAQRGRDVLRTAAASWE
jgi:hypothetical protein